MADVKESYSPLSVRGYPDLQFVPRLRDWSVPAAQTAVALLIPMNPLVQFGSNLLEIPERGIPFRMTSSLPALQLEHAPLLDSMATLSRIWKRPIGLGPRKTGAQTKSLPKKIYGQFKPLTAQFSQGLSVIRNRCLPGRPWDGGINWGR